MPQKPTNSNQSAQEDPENNSLKNQKGDAPLGGLGFFGNYFQGFNFAQENLDQKLADRASIEAAQNHLASQSNISPSADSHQALLESVAVGYGKSDAAGRWIEVSPHLCKLLGYTEDELLQLTYVDITHPKDLVVNTPVRNQLFAGEIDNMEVEERYIGRGGNVIWAHSFSSIIFGTDGLPLFRSHVIIDNTERKLYQKSLAENQAQIGKLLQYAPGVAYQYQLFDDGTSCFPYASSRISDIYGVTPEQVKLDASAVFTNIHPDDLEMIAVSIQESAKSLEEWSVEYRIHHPKKGLLWVSGRSNPERLSDGSTLWHGFIHDITDQKKTELALLEVLEEQSAILQSNLIGIARLQNRVYQWANDYFVGLLGYEVHEVIGNSSRLLYPDEDSFTNFGLDAYPIINSGNIYRAELRLKAKSGKFVWLTAAGTQYGNDPTESIWVFVDISAQKNAEAKMMESQQAAEVAYPRRPPALVTRRYPLPPFIELFSAAQLPTPAYAPRARCWSCEPRASGLGALHPSASSPALLSESTRKPWGLRSDVRPVESPL